MASNPSQDEMAVRLALVIKRIRARLRDTRPDEAKSLPISQLAILSRSSARGGLGSDSMPDEPAIQRNVTPAP